jgi:DNA polymerase-3 subunit beta
LSSVLIRSAGDRAISIRASDLDVQYDCQKPAEVEGEGGFCIPAQMLLDISKRFNKGAQVWIETKDGTAVVKSGRSRFTIQTLHETDFPELAAGEFSHSFKVPGEHMRALLDKTAFAISTEETRYYLNGVFFHAKEKGNQHTLAGCATDGHRLSLYQVELPEGAIGMPGGIVSRKTVGLVRKLCEGAEIVSVEMSATKIRVTTDAGKLTSKLIDGTFPDYDRVIPRNNDKVARLSKSELAAAVGRVCAITMERGPRLKLSLSSGVLALTHENSDTGRAFEEVVADYEGSAIEIGFNGRYLDEQTGMIAGDDIELAIADPGSPAIIRPVEGDQHLTVLMPVRF